MTLPYGSLKDLPKGVRDNLPKHAQEIYQAAFNNAWQEYGQAEARRGSASREETARRVAWAAVKGSYEKDERTEKWHKKQEA